MTDRILAYALFAGFIIAAALGWDWDRRPEQPHERSQKHDAEGWGVVGGRLHDGSVE